MNDLIHHVKLAFYMDSTHIYLQNKSQEKNIHMNSYAQQKHINILFTHSTYSLMKTTKHIIQLITWFCNFLFTAALL